MMCRGRVRALELFSLEKRLGGICIIVYNYLGHGYKEPDSSQKCTLWRGPDYTHFCNRVRRQPSQRGVSDCTQFSSTNSSEISPEAGDDAFVSEARTSQQDSLELTRSLGIRACRTPAPFGHCAGAEGTMLSLHRQLRDNGGYFLHAYLFPDVLGPIWKNKVLRLPGLASSAHTLQSMEQKVFRYYGHRQRPCCLLLRNGTKKTSRPIKVDSREAKTTGLKMLIALEAFDWQDDLGSGFPKPLEEPKDPSRPQKEPLQRDEVRAPAGAPGRSARLDVLYKAVGKTEEFLKEMKGNGELSSLESNNWSWQQNGGWVVVRSGERRQAQRSVLCMARTSRKTESVQDPQKSTRAIWPETKSLVREQWAQMCPASEMSSVEKCREGLRRARSVGEKRVLVTAGKRDLPKPALET
ncbi:hypothetical protein QYF61_012120 [Mycteria americana]|uniref:Uncharacterized protein n=1 Tax=Mycteria americana TaxID=33587 RepID=A0AAN7SA48_MYCAM|nr:hypothetical protein QYF61_012120 [Mycteria americana]